MWEIEKWLWETGWGWKGLDEEGPTSAKNSSGPESASDDLLELDTEGSDKGEGESGDEEWESGNEEGENSKDEGESDEDQVESDEGEGESEEDEETLEGEFGYSVF